MGKSRDQYDLAQDYEPIAMGDSALKHGGRKRRCESIDKIDPQEIEDDQCSMSPGTGLDKVIIR